MPTLTPNGNNSSIDWRNRHLFPPDEQVLVTGQDADGHVRMRDVTWADIHGDIANTPHGPLQIARVTRDADRPIHEEELIPRQPRSVRHSPHSQWPEEERGGDPTRWEMQLRRHPDPFGQRWDGEGLARELGVLPQVVLDLQVREDWQDEEWLIPERDAFGEIIGLATREMFPLPNEAGRLYAKGCRKGGKRGLYYKDGWWKEGDPILSPEGFSDSAACLSMGLTTVGRPSASSGHRRLLYLLADDEITEPLVIVADRDFNDADVSIGLEGARKAATYLAVRLLRPVLVAFPPDGFKDTREWLQDFCDGDLSPERLAFAVLPSAMKTTFSADAPSDACHGKPFSLVVMTS